MSNLIIVGEIPTGYNNYSLRTDNFLETLEAKLDNIIQLSHEHSASILLLGGIKERTSDINTLPVMIGRFFQAEVFMDRGSKKQGYRDILFASKCVSDAKKINLPIFNSVDQIPAYLVNHQGLPEWLLYTGDFEDTLVLDQLIADAVDEGKTLGIIAPSKSQVNDADHFKPVRKLFRDNSTQEMKPSVLLLEDGEAIYLEIDHNENTFQFENISGEEIQYTQSEFVKRLHEESLLADSDNDLMSSQVKLKSLIDNSIKGKNTSEISAGIIHSLFTQTSKTAH